MTDLLTLLREHDLPPRWDGLAAVWDGWHMPPADPVFICPPRAVHASCCEGCGSTATQPMNRGRVARVPAVTHDRIREVDAARDRLPAGQRHRIPGKALHRLVAFRCPDCQLDVVWDMDTREWWTLDHTDYGSEGSVTP